MKFWAKVKCEGEKDVGALIRTFFEEFNPKSSIVIRGKEAKLEINFDEKPPMKLIEVINQYEVIELNFGKLLDKYSEDEPKQTETDAEDSNQPEQAEADAEDSNQPERAETDAEDSNQPEQAEADAEDSNQPERAETDAEDFNQPERAETDAEDSNQPERAETDAEDFNQSKQAETDAEDSNQPKQVVEHKEDSNQPKQVVTQKEDSKHTEEPKKKNGRSSTKVVSEEKVNVPTLEELAVKATSFEEFVKTIAECLKMGNRQEFFENLVKVSTEVDNISWRELEKALKEKGVFYSAWDKISVGQLVSKNYPVTILAFLTEIGKYKDYSFGNKESNTEKTTEQVGEIIDKTGEVSKNIPKNRVKMECMPEILHFEETLGCVDKTQPIEDRVRYVLTAMGWQEKTAKEQQEIFTIANTAVRIEKMTFDKIFLKADISLESSINARMTFSTFINNFVSRYDSSQKVKLLDFLTELQKIIMHESEIESVDDFTD